jgi:outer membrane protein assembly factor BamB
MNLLSRVLIASLCALGATSAFGQEWTRFRGFNGSGVSTSTFPATWTAADYAWRAELPGRGHASPVLWGDRLFVTSAVEDSAERIVLCLNAVDGAILWERRFPSAVHSKHLRNSFASSTPAVDELHVYCVWSTPEEYTALALDHDGNEVWRRDLGPWTGEHSSGTSPIVWENLVLLGNEQGASYSENAGVESSVMALDRRTGATRWQTPRKTAIVAYSTPCLRQDKSNRLEVIFMSEAHGLAAYDLRSGNPLWELPVFDKRTVGSPIVAGGLVIGACGSGGGGNFVAAVRPGSRDGTPAELAYRVDAQAPYVPTPVADGGLLYLWGDSGIVQCLRVDGGEVVWKERVGGNFSGSPIIAGDKLYAIAEDGTVVVLRTGERYELLGRHELGEESRSTPSVAGGRMFLRTIGHITALEAAGADAR